MLIAVGNLKYLVLVDITKHITTFQSGCTKLYCHLQTMNIKTILSHWGGECFPSWAIGVFSILSHWGGEYIVVLICISLEANEAEHVFICFWPFGYSPLRTFKSLPIFCWVIKTILSLLLAVGKPYRDHLWYRGKEEWYFVQGQSMQENMQEMINTGFKVAGKGK